MIFQPTKFYLFVLLLFALFLTIGCSKKNDHSTTSAFSIIGTWYTDSAFVYVYDSNNAIIREVVYDNVIFYNDQYAQFNANDTANTQSVDIFFYDATGGINLIKQSAPYSFYDDSILVFNNLDTSIISITSNNRFVMHHMNHIQLYSNGYVEYYFSK